MPASFDWDTDRILCVRYYGIIDGEDAVDASMRMSADPRFDDLCGIIIDTREITENIASTEHIERLVAISRIMSTMNPRIRNAIVLNHDENTNALAGFYTFLAEELVWEIEMFRTMDEAREWTLAQNG